MDKKLPLISYTFVAMSGICFLGGLFILSGERGHRYVPTRGDISVARPIIRY